jgi:hypothetical protein
MKTPRIVRLALLLALAVLTAAGLSGCAWTPPAALNTNAATDSGDDFDPQVATDGAGNWVAVWWSEENLGGKIGGDLDILVTRSTDNGATWTPPAALNTNAASDLGRDEHPQVATDGGGNWVAVWRSDENLSGTIGTDLDILVSSSTDNGATWTPPAPLNTNAATDSGNDDHPGVTTDGEGKWVAVWQSEESLSGTIGTDYDIVVSTSTDNGVSWTPPAALNTNAATDSGDDEHPQVTTDGGRNWVAVWRSDENLSGTIGTDYDILVSTSTDNGVSWTPPAALNTNAATDSRGDLRPQVTTDGEGNWVAVWDSWDDLGGTLGPDFDILVARSTDNGITWTPPAALNTSAASDSGEDYSPQLTTDGGGKWVAVWYSSENLGGTFGTDYDILVARSMDNGGMWTAPAAVNTNAPSDSEDDYRPQVATDGGGNWVAVWESRENLGGTLGTDYDVLVARSTDTDGDGYDNSRDNCPDVYNPEQTNSDGDPPGDACDNCPTADNEDQADGDGDGMGNVCDPCPADPDCDDDSKGLGPSGGFFRDGVEAFMGTDPADPCADTTTANDETGAGESPWPPDFNDNGLVDIGDLVGLRYHWVPLGEPYGVRYDLNANGLCDIGDLVALSYYWVGTGYDTCTVG